MHTFYDGAIMEKLTATQARKELLSLVRNGTPVEIQHRENTMVLVPKTLWKQINDDLVNRQMDEALAQSQKRYTSEEVDAMLAEVKQRFEEKKRGKLVG